MTVPSTTSRDQQAGNGVTTLFTVPFCILDQTYLRVLFTAAGVTTEKALTTDYTVDGVGDPSTSVTFLAAPGNGVTITFLRRTAKTQETDYVPNDPFPAESHERALDKLTMQVQELDEVAGENGRTIKIPAEVSGVSTEMQTPAASKLWGWDATGTAPRNYDMSEIATAVAYADWRVDTFTASAAQTDFTLTSDPGSVGNLDVSIDGVTQVNGVDFTYSGTTLTFAIAMAGGEKVLARYGQALPTGVTNAGAVSFIQAGAGAVARTAQDKLRESVSVKDFGAVGNGVTDDTAALQAALDYAGTIVGTIITDKVNTVTASVRLPAGQYVTSAEIVVPEGVRLVGDGPALSVILPSHAGAAVRLGGADREYSNVQAESIGVIGNRSGELSFGAWTTTTTIGIHAVGCLRNCKIVNCMVSQCEVNFQIEDSYGFILTESYGVYATRNNLKSNNLTASVVRDNRFDWAEESGIVIDNSDVGADETIGLRIEGNAIQICWHNGILLTDCQVVDIANNFFEANYRLAAAATYTYADVNISEGANLGGLMFTVRGNFFTSGSSPDEDVYTAIRCNRAEYLNVYGNTCRDSFYYRFVDANDADVENLSVFGNALTAALNSRVNYASATTKGIIGDGSDGIGTIRIPRFLCGSFTGTPTVSGSNQISSEFRTTYFISTAAGNRQVSLRDADCVAGRRYTIKKTTGDGNILTVIPEGGSAKTVDGAASWTSTAAHAIIRVESDGNNWFTI